MCTLSLTFYFLYSYCDFMKMRNLGNLIISKDIFAGRKTFLFIICIGNIHFLLELNSLGCTEIHFMKLINIKHHIKKSSFLFQTINFLSYYHCSHLMFNSGSCNNVSCYEHTTNKIHYKFGFM